VTPAQRLIAEARAAGVSIARDGDRLILRAPAPPDEDLRRRIREAKAELLPIIPLLVAPDAPEVAWRAAVMREQIPPYPRPAPLLVAREVPYQPGHCLSCGDPIPAIRCVPCREAVALVLAEWRARHGTAAGRQPGSAEGS